MQADVSRWSDVDAAVGTAVRELGPIGILVNAAGILDGYAPVDELTPAVWERVISINLSGTFYACKRALVDMVRTGGGRIINISSVAGLVGSGGGPAYTASKHGVVGLARQLAVTHAGASITVKPSVRRGADVLRATRCASWARTRPSAAGRRRCAV